MIINEITSSIRPWYEIKVGEKTYFVGEYGSTKYKIYTDSIYQKICRCTQGDTLVYKPNQYSAPRFDQVGSEQRFILIEDYKKLIV